MYACAAIVYGRVQRLDAGVEFPLRMRLAAIGPVTRALEPADDLAAIAQELEEERRIPDPQIASRPPASPKSRSTPPPASRRACAQPPAVAPPHEAPQGTPPRRTARRLRARPAANARAFPDSLPWYCAAQAKPGRNSAYGRSLRGANTRLCRSIAQETRMTPDNATPLFCSLSASAAPRVVP